MINMKAKYIYEKFTQNSDPIKDLNIGLLPIIEYFLNYKSKYSADRNEYGPIKIADYLWMCAAENKIDYVKYLLDNDWDIHFENDRALRCAVHKNNYKMTKFLLDRGAYAKDGIYYAKNNNNKKIEELLRKYINKDDI